MPVRSRGSLLAGTAALAGLIVAGLGCHSSYSDHDSFSIPHTLSQSGPSPLVQRVGTAFQAGYPAQPVMSYDPASTLNPAVRPLTLQPVPVVQPTLTKREVIASSWSPVQRVSAEQPAAGPDLPAGMTLPPASSVQPSRPVAFAPRSSMPIGAALPSASGPLLEGGESAVPGNIMLPAPRPLGAPMPPAVVQGGAMPPPHPPYPNVPREFENMALPTYVVEPPDILLIQASNRITLNLQPLSGQHLVAPDGTVNLGIYGRVRVVGMTLDQVADAVAARLLEVQPGLLREAPEYDKEGKEIPKTKGKYLKDFQDAFTSVELVKKEMQVDVLAYNSKFYYVITDGGGYGQQVYPIPITGNERVLDALAKVNGLPAVASKRRVWVARATRAGQPPKVFPVDWMAITKCGSGETNYQIFPGDRVYVDSNNLIKADSFLAKLYSPILRTFGVTLLGASTVNTIKLGSTSGAAGGIGLIR
jgi:polysaccharide export outer membrane protein